MKSHISSVYKIRAPKDEMSIRSKTRQLVIIDKGSPRLDPKMAVTMQKPNIDRIARVTKLNEI
jgi:hypothetical protein